MDQQPKTDGNAVLVGIIIIVTIVVILVSIYFSNVTCPTWGNNCGIDIVIPTDLPSVRRMEVARSAPAPAPAPFSSGPSPAPAPAPLSSGPSPAPAPAPFSSGPTPGPTPASCPPGFATGSIHAGSIIDFPSRNGFLPVIAGMFKMLLVIVLSGRTVLMM
jgi:hypothetical protein